MQRRKKASMSIISIAMILVPVIVTLAQFGSIGTSHGQGNLTIGNLTLTPEQKAAICDPNNPLSKLDFVNTTESRICGIPKTITNTTSANMTTANTTIPDTTTGAESPPSSTIAPSAVPPSE
ncbi:MAG: hypothetical protein ACJ709_04120 [Nitrososphaeraceae archaeon]|jgi:hypothetical protein